MKVIIREIRVTDSEVSWKWRNDPEIWKLTGRTSEDYVTIEIENNWLKDVIKRDFEKRFAICIDDEQKYIGNVQLTHIQNGEARFHIFIGEKDFWGKGIASEATRQILDYAFNYQKLKRIYLFVKKENVRAISAYLKNGFKVINETEGDLIMEVINE